MRNKFYNQCEIVGGKENLQTGLWQIYDDRK